MRTGGCFLEKAGSPNVATRNTPYEPDHKNREERLTINVVGRRDFGHRKAIRAPILANWTTMPRRLQAILRADYCDAAAAWAGPRRRIGRSVEQVKAAQPDVAEPVVVKKNRRRISSTRQGSLRCDGLIPEPDARLAPEGAFDLFSGCVCGPWREGDVFDFVVRKQLDRLPHHVGGDDDLSLLRSLRSSSSRIAARQPTDVARLLSGRPADHQRRQRRRAEYPRRTRLMVAGPAPETGTPRGRAGPCNAAPAGVCRKQSRP